MLKKKVRDEGTYFWEIMKHDEREEENKSLELGKEKGRQLKIVSKAIWEKEPEVAI